jgi:hypothetical protein
VATAGLVFRPRHATSFIEHEAVDASSRPRIVGVTLWRSRCRMPLPSPGPTQESRAELGSDPFIVLPC